MNRGTMGVNSLPKTVTRQRRARAFEPRPFCAWVRFLVYNTGLSGLVQYRWTGLDLLTADRLKMQYWKIVNSSKYSKLLYLRFPPLQIRTCIFHPFIFVLTYSVLAYSILRYFRFPYLRFQSPTASKLQWKTNIKSMCPIDWQQNRSPWMTLT